MEDSFDLHLEILIRKGEVNGNMRNILVKFTQCRLTRIDRSPLFSLLAITRETIVLTFQPFALPFPFNVR